MDVEGVLQACLSKDNATRKSAEAILESYRAHADSLASAILSVVQSSADKDIRLMGSIVSKRMLCRGKDPLWRALSEDAQQATFAGFLASLAAEPVRTVRHNVVECVAEIAEEIIESAPEELNVGAVPSLWSFMQTSASSTAELQESAFMLFERMSGYIAKKFTAADAFPSLASLLTSKMVEDTAPIFVRVSAARAGSALIQQIQHSDFEYFTELVPGMLHLLASTASTNGTSESDDIDEVQLAAGALLQVATRHAYAFEGVLPQAVELLSQISGQVELDSSLRRLCMETLVSIAESSPSMVRKMEKGAFFTAVLPVLFSMLLEYGEAGDEVSDETWQLGGGEEDEVLDADDRQVEIGEEGLSRIAQAIKTKTFLPALKLGVEAFLHPRESADSWKYRAAALVALQQCAILDFSNSQMADIVNLLAPYTQDPHPRVRHAALKTVGAYCHHAGVAFQMHTHKVTIPLLIAGMNDPVKRVRLVGCMGVLLYSENLEPGTDAKIITPYFEKGLLEILIANLTGAHPQDTPENVAAEEATALANGNSKKLKKITNDIAQAALTALSATLQAAGAAVAPLYDMLADGLKQILGAPEEYGTVIPCAGYESLDSASKQAERSRIAAARQLREMKGKALECLTTLGRAAGMEIFGADAMMALEGVVTILDSLKQEKENTHASVIASVDEDPVQSYCWDAIPRLAVAIGPTAFEPFVDRIVPHLIAACATTGSVMSDIQYEGDEDDDDDDDNNNNNNFNKAGGQKGAGGGEGEESDGEEVDLTIEHRADGTTVRVRSADLEDKHAALDSLASLYQVMHGASMAPYAVATLDAFTKTLKLPGGIFSQIRISCCMAFDDVFAALATQVTVADLSECLAAGVGMEGGPEVTAESSPGALFISFLYTALKSLEKVMIDEDESQEDDEDGTLEGLRTAIAGIGDTLRAACARWNFKGEPAQELVARKDRYLSLVPTIILQSLTVTMKRVRQACVQRRAARIAERTVMGKNYDEEQLEQMEELDHMDTLTMTILYETWGDFLRTHPSVYIPIYTEMLAPMIEDTSNAACAVTDRHFALFLIDDVLEYVADDAFVNAEAGAHYASLYLPILFRDCVSDEKILAQAAVYGLGSAAAACSPTFFAPFLMETLQTILQVIMSRVEAGTIDEVHDNAVSALVRVVSGQLEIGSANAATAAAGGVSRSSLMDGIVSRLPLTNDLEEAAITFTQICEWLSNMDADLLGSGNGSSTNLIPILKALAWACTTENMNPYDDEVFRMRKHASKALNDLRAALNDEQLGSVFTMLSEEERQVLLKIMSSPVEAGQEGSTSTSAAKGAGQG